MPPETPTTETPALSGDNRQPNGQFGPNNVANPSGRPVGSVSITTLIRQKLQEIPIGQTQSYLEFIVKEIINRAVVDKDVNMMKTIWSYMDGAPKQKLEVGGDKESIAELTEFFRTVANQSKNAKETPPPQTTQV